MNRRAALVAGTGAAVTAAAGDRQALARITGISKPELVPQEPGVKVIDIPEVMSGANRADLDKIIEDIDRIYGVHLKVLVARFPDTPGEAIFKYWDNSDGREFGGKTDLNSIIMFVDDKETTGGNSLKFDVGDNVNLLAPNGRWFTSLKAKYGTKKAVNEYGAGGAIVECARAILDGLTNTDEVGAGMFY
jgi:hypothetical protein